MLPLPLDCRSRPALGEFRQEVGGRGLNEVKAFIVPLPLLSGLECSSVQVPAPPPPH